MSSTSALSYCYRCRGSKEIIHGIDGKEYPGTLSKEMPCGGICQPCPSCSTKEVPMAGGLASSSPCPPFHLIPTIGLQKLAERFQSGVDRKGDKAWNAVSANQAVLEDKAFAIERISHVIDHAMKLRDKLQTDDLCGLAEDDDAGAIAWAGTFLCCVVDGFLRKYRSEQSS